MASASVSGLSGTFEYFAQAVDPTGNLAVALDHGIPFQGKVSNLHVFLPLVRH